MRLQELFLIETTEDDRELISLSSSISDYLDKHADAYGDEPEDLGTIGDLFDTSLEVLNPIHIQIQSDRGIRRLEKDKNADVIRRANQEGIAGVWDSNTQTIILNSDELGTDELRSTITHELRHALDDFKSDFKASSSKSYSTPKDKANRRVTNDPYMGNTAYLAEPAEINARFLQVLHHLRTAIQKAATNNPQNAQSVAMTKFKELLEYYRIAELFPQKEQSRDYKRLMKRGIDFIQQELG